MSAVELLDQAISAIDALLLASPPAAAPPPATPAAVPAPAAKPAPKPAPAPKAAPPAPAAAAKASTSGSGTDAELFGKALIKVAKILSCDMIPNSEKLYKLRVDLGEGDNRQVCAGLRQFLEPAQLQGALVCVVANLKPAKLAGEASEAMILAAEHEVDGKLLVRTLVPPAGSEPGDVVCLEGTEPGAALAPPKQMKGDAWKSIGGGLAVGAGRRACFSGTPLVTSRGPVTLPDEIPDGSSIH